ncbi:MAG: hypothetical protein A2984_02740 [Omnitrophica WOR_2 bacterium RIFCSPLOWO2_01_FULL_41_12]|nr:MAG: hypothetical protein A2984_02740 [Omnitrophica WOR_2 bacterium RIFCSPLOWO2_01_FULL_41_12]
MKEIVFLNGKFISKDEAKLSVLEPGFLYGFGLFETMRAYQKKIVYLGAHLKRLKNSCKLIALKCPYSPDKFKRMIKETVKINGFSDTYVRLTLWKSKAGTDILITAKKYQPYSPQRYIKGFSARISSLRQNENSLLGRIKSTNYLLCRLAYLEAKTKGLDEAIILNNRGYIAEGSRSNIFLVKDKALFTPSLQCGCLAGITRKVIFDLAKKYKIKICEGNFTIRDLYEADEAFFTNSLMGVMPLENKCGRLTKFFIKKYFTLLKF